MPKGKSWMKAELDATRARNAAMVASKHNHRATTTDPTHEPLAIAQHENSKYRGVVTMHVDRLAAIETERDAALSSAAARSAELDAEKHMTQYQIDTLKRKLADAEAAEAKLRVEVEDLKRKATESSSQSVMTVAVTPVRAMLPYTPAAPARDRLTAGDAYARRGGAVQGSIDGRPDEEDRHLGSSGGSGGSSGERILGMSTGMSSDGKDSCDTGVKSASQPRSVPSTGAAGNGSHKRPKRICQKNPPPRFSLGDAEAVSGGVILIDPSSEKDLSKDLSKDSKDDDVTPTEFNKFNEFNKFKIPSSPGLETLATEAVEERARSLSRSSSPVIPAGKSPGSVGEAVGSIPVGVERKKRRGRPHLSGHKRKAIDESDEDFEEVGVDIVFEEEDEDEEMEMEMEIEMEEVMEVEKELKVNVEVPAETAQVVKRRRGRPKGSKNKRTLMRERRSEAEAKAEAKAEVEVETMAEVETKDAAMAEVETMAEVEPMAEVETMAGAKGEADGEAKDEEKENVEPPPPAEAGVVKRGRGRPKGSKNRKVSGESPPALGETEGTTERAAKRVYRCKACGECGHSVKTCGRA